jgi:hypothetical protein
MPQICLYTRADGLLEPRSQRAWNFFQKQQPGTLLIGNFASDRRTTLQNNYLNGWVYKTAVMQLNDAGHSIHGHPFTRDRLHAIMQEAFLVADEFEFDGVIKKVYESTAEMSRTRFIEYVDEQLKPFLLAQWEIDVPNPKDDFYVELHREIFGREV